MYWWALICYLNSFVRVERSNHSILDFGGNTLKISEFGEYYVYPKISFYGEIKLWGAGGGSNGGQGGYSSGSVYFDRNMVYILHVGQGGIQTRNGGQESFGRGGYAGVTMSSIVYVGTGGGYSGLFAGSVSQSNCIILAGGGGGGMIYDYYGVIRGGNGGGINGEGGYYPKHPTYAGGGGTQAAGGSRGTGGWDYGSLNGSPLQGGRGALSQSQSYSGSGGGGGYFGGGGGTNGNYAGGPGGGGSGFIHSSLVRNGTTSFFIDDLQRIDNCGEKSKNGLFVLNIGSEMTSAFTHRPMVKMVLFLQILF